MNSAAGPASPGIAPAIAKSAALLSLFLTSMVGSVPHAEARNIFREFTTAPTFAPPTGCVPRLQAYGVLAECERTIEPGHSLVVIIDTVIGFFGAPTPGNVERFLNDHVVEIETFWKQNYPHNNLAFSSRRTGLKPANTRDAYALCKEYSISVERWKSVGARRVPVVVRTEGLTCAWEVQGAAAGKHNVELFWLEVSDEHAPSLGQTPVESFDTLVREVFASARL